MHALFLHVNLHAGALFFDLPVTSDIPVMRVLDISGAKDSQMSLINQFRDPHPVGASVLKMNNYRLFVFSSRACALFRCSPAEETKRERIERTDARAHALPLVMMGESEKNRFFFSF